MPKTVKVQIQRTCPECGNTYTGRQRSRTCSKVCAFWSRFDRSGGLDACWPWQGHINPTTGYGDVPSRLGVDGKRGMAHRQAWKIHNLCDPDKLNVLHRCDNRRCGNPAHLRVGSQRANVMDAWAKGRRPVAAPGEDHSRARLTDDIVREIRSSADAAAVLARRYGVSDSAIRHVRRGLTWRHVA